MNGYSKRTFARAHKKKKRKKFTADVCSLTLQPGNKHVGLISPAITIYTSLSGPTVSCPFLFSYKITKKNR